MCKSFSLYLGKLHQNKGRRTEVKIRALCFRARFSTSANDIHDGEQKRESNTPYEDKILILSS